MYTRVLGCRVCVVRVGGALRREPAGEGSPLSIATALGKPGGWRLKQCSSWAQGWVGLSQDVWMKK